MNAVPLEAWIYLERSKGGPKYYDIKKYPKLFKAFKETGLQ